MPSMNTRGILLNYNCYDCFAEVNGVAHHIELPGMLMEVYEASVRHKLPNVDFTLSFSDEPSGRAQE